MPRRPSPPPQGTRRAPGGRLSPRPSSPDGPHRRRLRSPGSRPRYAPPALRVGRKLLALYRNSTRDAFFDGRGCHCLGNRIDDPWIEDARDDVLGPEFVVADDPCYRPRGGHLHVLGDAGCTYVERPPEDPGEREEIVDLIREVRASRRDDGRIGSGDVG